MGIKYFFSWFRARFPDKIKPVNKRLECDIDTLLLDLNGIFHTCAQKIFGYGDDTRLRRLMRPRSTNSNTQIHLYHESVWNEIVKIVRIANPRRQLVLCIDGVAPISKQNQQRQRRFKTVADRRPEDFDRNCITPGTRFMHSLSEYLKSRIEEYRKESTLDIYYSDSSVCGEGEHKLMWYIRKYGTDTDSYCVYGMDADLIMLSITTHKNHFHILRENHRSREELFHIDLENIRELIYSELSDCEKTNATYVLNDFVFMVFAMGNDFLPNLPNIEILDGGIDVLIEVYHKTTGYLTRSNGKIDLQVFKNFLYTLSQYEKSIAENKTQSPYIDTLLTQCYTIDKNGNSVVDMNRYKEMYYLKKFGEEYNIEDIVCRYVAGLQWVLYYYTSGITSWSWFYPYYYAPFVSDIIQYIDKCDLSTVIDKSLPITPFQQLMCVLPRESAHLLPTPLEQALKTSELLDPYFPKTIEIDLDGKRNDWEGIVVLPFINIAHIQHVYFDVLPRISKGEKIRDQFSTPLFFTHINTSSR